MDGNVITIYPVDEETTKHFHSTFTDDQYDNVLISLIFSW